jgi:hypothetical protein
MELEQLAGQTIAHYHALALLRCDETGAVFLAQDVHLRRQVDLLVYRLAEEQRGVFVQRARLLAQLDHPNLLPVYDYGEQPDFVYMICPHQEGEGLAAFLAKQQALTVEQMLRITEQFFQAILALDEQGLIRRPIPLADLFLRPDGSLVMSLASVMGTALPGVTETTAHTPTSFLRQGGELLRQLLARSAEGKVEHVEEIALRLSGGGTAQAYRTIADCLADLHELQAQFKARRWTADESGTRVTRSLAEQSRLIPQTDMTAQKTLDQEEFIPTQVKAPAAADDALKMLPVRRTGNARVLLHGLLVAGLAVVLIAGSVGSYLLFSRQTRPPASTRTAQSGLTSAALTQTALAGAARTQTAVAALATCPPLGQARSFVNSPLPAEHGKSLVYLSDANGVQKLERYDVLTGKTSEILQASDATRLANLQLSEDGQWIFFTRQAASTEFQVVRIDGQYLQTLYCTPSQSPIQSFDPVKASPDLHYIAFSEQEQALYLLDTQQGKLAPALAAASSLDPFLWLDHTRLYLTTTSIIAADPRTLSLFDTRNGMSQQSQSLPQVLTFDPVTSGSDNKVSCSADGSQMFYTSLNPNLIVSYGPNELNSKPASGGPSHQLLSIGDPSQPVSFASGFVASDIRDFQLIPPDSILLLLVDSTGPQTISPIALAVASFQQLAQQGRSALHEVFANTSANTFWFGNAVQGTGILDSAAAPPWTNVSRDGKSFALVEDVYQAGNYTAENLVLGSLDGSANQALQVLTTGPAQGLTIVGWTTFA